MFDPKYWNLDDPYSLLDLNDITPLSARAWSAFVRSKSKNIVKEGFLNFIGSIDMMLGLEYHYVNFCSILNEISELPILDVHLRDKKLSLIHEAVAYLNRLGQFYYFASSDFVTTKVNNWENIIPTIIKFKRFRDKHSAHRSLDKPRNQDSSHHQQIHALALSSIGGLIFSPKHGKNISITQTNFRQKIWTDAYPCFQLAGDEYNDTLNLCIEKEHPVFSSEAYDLIYTLLSHP